MTASALTMNSSGIAPPVNARESSASEGSAWGRGQPTTYASPSGTPTASSRIARRAAKPPASSPARPADLLGCSTAFLLGDPVAAVGARLDRAAVLAHADEAGEQAPLGPGDRHVDAVTDPIAAQPDLARVAGLGQVLLGGPPGLGGIDPVGIAGTERGEIQLAGAGSGGLLGDVDPAPLGGEDVGPVEAEPDHDQGQDREQRHQNAEAAPLTISCRDHGLPVHVASPCTPR